MSKTIYRRQIWEEVQFQGIRGYKYCDRKHGSKKAGKILEQLLRAYTLIDKEEREIKLKSTCGFKTSKHSK